MSFIEFRDNKCPLSGLKIMCPLSGLEIMCPLSGLEIISVPYRV